MRNKIDEALDAIFGAKVKGRWVKVLGSLVALLVIIGVFIFLITNLGYNNGKFFLKPWQVKIDVDVDLKKEINKNKIEADQK